MGYMICPECSVPFHIDLAQSGIKKGFGGCYECGRVWRWLFTTGFHTKEVDLHVVAKSYLADGTKVYILSNADFEPHGLMVYEL